MTDHKIIIIGSDFKWEEEQLLASATNSEFILLDELDVIIGHTTSFMKGSVDIFSELSGDERFIIRRSRGGFEKLVALVEILKKRNFVFTDSFRAISTNLNKEIFLATIESDIFPHPSPSFFVENGNAGFSDDLDFPLISKPVCGRHGDGIVIHENLESLQKEAKESEENLLVQKFLEVEKEYRIFVIGDRAIGAVEKTAAPGEKVANYSAGATFVAVDFPKKYMDEAVRLCGVQEIDIGGVDVVKSKSGDHYILEINRCPEFKAFSSATGINVAEAIVDFIKDKQ